MAATSSNPHALIVDDDKVMGELLVALLTLKGYGVTHASSGIEALQLIERLGPRLEIVLCDIHMPGLRGDDLAVALSAARKRGTLPADILLLGMSGSSPAISESKLFDAFLHKPFAMEDLAAAIDRVRSLRSHKTPETAEDPAAYSFQATPESTRLTSPLDDRTFAQLSAQLAEDQLRQLYEMTLADVRMRLERMAASAQEGDDASIRREAHAIKGGCGMVGALELQELAAATEGGSALDTSALADFTAACQRLQRMLDERF